MDGGAWWVTVHGVANSRTLTERLHFHFLFNEFTHLSKVILIINCELLICILCSVFQFERGLSIFFVDLGDQETAEARGSGEGFPGLPLFLGLDQPE